MFLVIYEEKTKHLANYYILLANTNVPQYTEGLNSLQASIQVSLLNDNNYKISTLVLKLTICSRLQN